MILYVIDEFPTLSETFVINEIEEMREQGEDVRFYPLRRGHGINSGRNLTSMCIARPPGKWRLVLLAVCEVLLSPSWIISLGTGWGGGRRRVTWRRRVQELFTLLHARRLHRFLPREVGHVSLHAHFAGRPGDVCRVVWWKWGVSYSVTVHASDIYAPADVAGLRDTLGGAAIVVCVSDFIRRFIVERRLIDTPERLAVLHCGIRPKTFARPGEHCENDGEALVLGVGRFVEKKGFHHLIDAAATLTRRRRNLRVVLIGDGPQRWWLEARARELAAPGVVSVVGPMPQAQLAGWYRRATVFVLPCVEDSAGDMDGIPNVLMEAMAAGVPVISTAISGVPELVVHQVSGLLTPPGDTAALERVVEQLLDDPGLAATLGSEGARRVQEQFNLHTQVRRLRILLRDAHSPPTAKGRQNGGASGGGVLGAQESNSCASFCRSRGARPVVGASGEVEV